MEFKTGKLFGIIYPYAIPTQGNVKEAQIRQKNLDKLYQTSEKQATQRRPHDSGQSGSSGILSEIVVNHWLNKENIFAQLVHEEQKASKVPDIIICNRWGIDVKSRPFKNAARWLPSYENDIKRYSASLPEYNHFYFFTMYEGNTGYIWLLGARGRKWILKNVGNKKGVRLVVPHEKLPGAISPTLTYHYRISTELLLHPFEWSDKIKKL